MSQSRVASALQSNAQTTTHQSESELTAENERLNYEIAQMRLRVIELERAADTDPLVPVFNRRAFMRELSRAQAVNARYDIPSSLIFFDLNGFKRINDRFGHGIGDDLLRKIGTVIVSGVRSCDLVARLGGDEFGVLQAHKSGYNIGCDLIFQKSDFIFQAQLQFLHPPDFQHIRCAHGHER